ncbi:MAG TPA: two-component regulator propeller domain-containing protein [Parafilimonas sp.]|nr:two-component regulator propeller domain-containing protein [Parafilimonas sp.]
MFYTRICLFILLLLPCTLVFSQQERQYAFTHFSTTNGLVSNSVFNIVQDKQGYIWLATVDGLQRYDGNRFLTFRHSSADPHSIPADFIPQLTKDEHDNLWLATGGKIGFFDTKKFSFTAVPIEGEDISYPYNIRFYGNASNGYMALYAEGKGFFIYDPDAKMFKHKISFRFPEKQRLYEIESVDNGRKYWIAAYGGVLVYDDETGNLNYRGHNPDSNIFINHLKNDTSINSFYGSKNDTLWYSSWPLVAYAPFIHTLNLKTGEKKTYSISKLFNYGYVELGGALFQANGRKWFYGRSFIAEYTGNENEPFQLIPNQYTSEQSITFDRAYQMIEDRQHNIWVATDNGVFVFNPDMQVFNNYHLRRGPGKEIIAAGVTNACELKNGNVFITSWGSGLFYYDNKFNVLTLPPELKELTRPYMIWCVHEHSKTGLAWMGMQGGGMAVYDPAKKKLDIMNDTVFRRSTIRQVTEDAFGNLWFGMQSGRVVKWNMKTANGDIHKGYEVIRAKGSYYIQKMYTGRDGAIWVCSLGDGLFKYDPATNKLLAHYTKNNVTNEGLSDNSVNDVYFYNDSLLLIADGALDILNLKTNTITHINTENGLPSNTVLSVEADKEGILWLGMANQLCRFDLQKKILSTFDRRDGISYDLFNPAADYKMRDGRLMYLTDKNFIAFRPSSVIATAGPGNVVITNFSLGNTVLLVDSLARFQTIDLKYDNTSISIEFSALNYTPQNKLHYYYMLEGIDKSWKAATNLNEAVYNYLPAGDYTFKVKAENTEGQQSAVTTLQLRVSPPFWKTWWFFGFFILLALAAFYWVDRERINKIQALQKVRTQIARNLHKDINTTLNHINLLSEMAKIKADSDIERSKDYIEQISDKSRTMIDSMDDILWTLNPENDSMEKTILRMKEYAEAMQNTYPTGVIMEVDEKIKQLKLDMKVRHEIFFIFKKTLHNIAMHANNSESVINVDHAGKQLLMKIQNNEVKLSGTDAEQAIKEIAQRAELINAELDIQNDSKGISLILAVVV